MWYEIRCCVRLIRRRNRCMHHLIRIGFFFSFSVGVPSSKPILVVFKWEIQIDNVLLALCRVTFFLIYFRHTFEKLNFVRVQHGIAIKRVRRRRGHRKIHLLSTEFASEYCLSSSVILSVTHCKKMPHSRSQIDFAHQKYQFSRHYSYEYVWTNRICIFR